MSAVNACSHQVRNYQLLCSICRRSPTFASGLPENKINKVANCHHFTINSLINKNHDHSCIDIQQDKIH